jgi:hypothetical protein
MSSVKEDQARLLSEHKDAMALEANSMRKGIEVKDVTVAMRHALAMLEELRTSSLTPKVRFENGTQIFCACRIKFHIERLSQPAAHRRVSRSSTMTCFYRRKKTLHTSSPFSYLSQRAASRSLTYTPPWPTRRTSFRASIFRRQLRRPTYDPGNPSLRRS